MGLKYSPAQGPTSVSKRWPMGEGLGLLSKKVLINGLEDCDGSWLITLTDGTQLRSGVNSGKSCGILQRTAGIVKEHCGQRRAQPGNAGLPRRLAQRSSRCV